MLQYQEVFDCISGFSGITIRKLTTRKKIENDSHRDHRAAGRYSVLLVYSVAKNILYIYKKMTNNDALSITELNVLLTSKGGW